jgi:hypothetical protein
MEEADLQRIMVADTINLTRRGTAKKIQQNILMQ